MLEPNDWSFPVPIAYGPGRLGETGTRCRAAGMRNPLIVTDRGSAGLPFLSALQGHLAASGLASAIFSDISPNPKDSEIAAGREAYRAGAHDGIVGIGGGSGMDGAKAVCLTARNGLAINAFDYLLDPPDLAAADFPPLILIPTTAGTGAETESTAMITDTVQMAKFCAAHPACRPAHAILDPELTLDLPRNLTAWTGIDALVHAIEAYSVPDFHPLCDGAALEGLRLIWRYLPQAHAEPGDLTARGGMLVGSCLAGVAFLKGLGLVHSISHMVGAEFDTQHGLTNAVVLPSVLRFNASVLADRIAPVADAMELDDRSFEGVYRVICALLDDLAIPRTLAGLGVTEDRIEPLAAKAMLDAATATSPRIPSEGEMIALLTEAFRHGRQDRKFGGSRMSGRREISPNRRPESSASPRESAGADTSSFPEWNMSGLCKTLSTTSL